MKKQERLYTQLYTCAKRARQQNQDIIAEVLALFVNYYKETSAISEKIAQYWKKKYIESSVRPNIEPTEEHLVWLVEVADFLQGEKDAGMNFPLEDWITIREIINSEANNLPVEILTSLLSILIERNLFE